MNKLPHPKFLTYNLFLFIVTTCAISCNDKKEENNNAIFKIEPIKAETTIDFNLIDCLNESNKKTIALADLTFRQTKDVNSLKSLLEIKKDHIDIDVALKNLTEKNMIIIPKTGYELNIIPDSLKGKNSRTYLLRTLKNEIKNEITLFDQITKTSKNIDFKIFAEKYKRTLQANNKHLNNCFKNLK
jgi:hypothetical protein